MSVTDFSDVSDDDSWSGPDTKKKKRRSRWADNEVEKSIMSGLPTTIPQGLTKEQEEQYLCWCSCVIFQHFIALCKHSIFF